MVAHCGNRLNYTQINSTTTNQKPSHVSLVLFEKGFHLLQNLSQSIFLRNNTRTPVSFSLIMAIVDHVKLKKRISTNLKW